MASAFAARGAVLVITGRDETRLQQTLEAIGTDKHQAIIGDLTEQESCARIADSCGALDGIVHSAGISRLAPLRLATAAHIDEVWRTNYSAPLQLTQRLLAKNQIRAEGSILFMSSIAAFIGVAGVSVYSGTKAALIASMRCLAMEVVKRKIRVNCLAPALVETPLLEATGQVVGSLEKQEAAYPLGFGKPADVANAAIFYLSPASRWITGTTLVMDGGLTIS
jgi:NAD(P)-dependent dehydrogenase (short-subunit alcohol dehydrogenase family)